ncbi:ketopantoate reductase family protein [Sulfobacillus thermosulfidooxidans]|uniref:ketopantoate reductase family protein n=1 Tax=Sulfobacillus thermosulfidooxidans TaxID=28034 RepID=UPI0009FA6690|nr:ketopantoate reductase family protein [Sulfobacillus thermosulfidooxidans]
MMTVLIIGAGALGSYFGGKLIQEGVPVTFLVRSGRYQQIQNEGLVVRSVHGDFRLHPPILQRISPATHYDVVFLTVKSYHLPNLWDTLDQLVSQGSVIIPFLNGVAHMDELLTRYGPEHVLGGICYTEATLLPSGVVEQTSPMQELVVGSVSGKIPGVVGSLREAFARQGVQFTESQSIMTDMWIKYIFLVVFSAATTVFRSSIGDILADEQSASWLSYALEETITVAKSLNVALPEDVYSRIWNRIQSLPLSMTSSMFKDSQRGYPLEVEHLQGYLARQAWTHHVQIPRMETAYWALRPLALGQNIAKMA